MLVGRGTVRVATLIKQSSSQLQLFGFSNTIPVVTYDFDLSNMTLPQYRNEEYKRFIPHRSNPSGLVQMQMPGLNKDDGKYITPSTKDTLKEIFKLDAKGFITTSWPTTYLYLVGNKGITNLSNHDPLHKKLRKVLNPFFMDQPLKDRFLVVQSYGKQFIQSLLSQDETDNKYIHVSKKSKKFAFDVVFGTIFGNELYKEELGEKMREHFQIYSMGVSDTNMENLNNPDTRLGTAMIHRGFIMEYIENLISQSIELYQQGKLDQKSIIYKIIDSKVFDDDEIFGNADGGMEAFKENILILVFAGYDTTASTICNILYCLNQFRDHPFIVKMKKELKTRQNELNDFDFIMNNEFLDAFSKEIMRYIVVVTGIPKMMAKDGEINGCPMSKGTSILIHNYINSKNDNIWGDTVNEFNPQRFIDNPPGKQVWYPFGLGTKICLGWKLAYLEMKIVTAMLMDYQVDLDQNRLEKAQGTGFNFYDVYGRLKLCEEAYSIK